MHHRLPGGHLPRLVPPCTGDGLEVLNQLATIAVRQDETISGINAVLFDAVEGFGPPLHVHRDDDVVVYVIEGSLLVRAGDLVTEAVAGAIVVLPRHVAHTFRVRSTRARYLAVASGTRDRPSLDRLVEALGAPVTVAAADGFPEPRPIEPGRVATTCARHGVDVIGPPPTDIDPPTTASAHTRAGATRSPVPPPATRSTTP